MADDIKEDIQKILGPKYKVKNKQEQHADFFKMLKIEKLMSYLILSFIVIIAVFNLIGTLSMLIHEKKESIATLRSMGASKQLVTRIFLFEGWMISLVGVFLGLILGILLIFIQQTYGLISFGGAGVYIVDAYPIALKGIDAVNVFVTVVTIGFLATWYPVRVIVKRYYYSLNGSE